PAAGVRVPGNGHHPPWRPASRRLSRSEAPEGGTTGCQRIVSGACRGWSTSGGMSCPDGHPAAPAGLASADRTMGDLRDGLTATVSRTRGGRLGGAPQPSRRSDAIRRVLMLTADCVAIDRRRGLQSRGHPTPQIRPPPPGGRSGPDHRAGAAKPPPAYVSGEFGDHPDRAGGALRDADPAALAVVEVDLVALAGAELE